MITRTIVFIHGAFVTKHSWDLWVERCQAQGYRTIAIAWPGRDRPVRELKQAHPEPEVGRLTFKQVLDHHIKALQSLDEKPVLIGHSTGGLLTQLLLQRDLGVAGVAVDSVPPQGVIPTQLSFIRAGLPVLNPFVPISRPYYMTFKQFQYAFANGLPLEAQKAAYDAQTVPESRRVAWGALSSVAKVDFKKARPPLLFIAGTKDHFIPESLNRTNHRRYKASPAVTDFKEFPGRNHYIIGAEGWEEVADYVLNWLHQQKVLTASGRVSSAVRDSTVSRDSLAV
jgi:pimeloyl-ACP methyl ester carboxylesterase